jgi:tetratricopeptide repeat protein/DUF2914 family protein
MPDTRDPQSVIAAAEQAAAAGDYASAERLLREAADLQEASLGPLHPDLANTLNNLGVVCEITDKPADAERCFRRAYEIATAVLEPDHPFVATSRKNLEDFCAARGIEVEAPAPPRPPAVDVAREVVRQTEPETEPPTEPQIEPQIEPTKVPAQRSMDQAPRPEAATRSSRPIPMGALVAGGLLVILLAATMWFRSNDGAPPAASPAPTATARPSEPRPVEQKPVEPKPLEPKSAERKPVESKPIEPKASDVPKAKTPPPVVLDVQLCRDLGKGGPATGGWRCDPVSSPAAPGRLLFYTRLKAPTATTVQHRWYRGDRLRQTVELAIRANPVSGYRTYSRNTVWESGEWRVELRTRDGAVLHEERFTVR